MKRSLSVGLSALCLLSTPALSASTVIGFDDLGAGALVAGQYAGLGVLFGGDATVLQYPNYNYPGYPAASSPNVVYSPASGRITLTAIGATFTTVGAYFSSTTGIGIAAYDFANRVIAAASGAGNYGASSYLSLDATGARKIVFTGPARHFTLDDVAFSAVPVPGPIAGAGAPALLAAMALAARRRWSRAERTRPSLSR